MTPPRLRASELATHIKAFQRFALVSGAVSGLVAVGPLLGVVAGEVLGWQLLDRDAGRVVAALGVLSAIPVGWGLVYFGLRRYALFCPACGHSLMASPRMVLATGTCSHCGHRLWEHWD